MSMKLKFNIENMGNIDKATITIKPLTIIAGVNGSGKTFVTKSLYTILNSVYKNHFAHELSKALRHLHAEHTLFFIELRNPSQTDLDYNEKFLSYFYEIGSFIDNITQCRFNDQAHLLNKHTKDFEEFESLVINYFKLKKEVKKFQKYSEYIKSILSLLDQFMNSIENRENIIINNISDSLENGLKKNFQITNIQSLINRNSDKNLKLSLDSVGEVEINKKQDISFSFQNKWIEEVQSTENIVFFDSPIYIKIRKALENSQKESRFLFSRKDDKYLKGYPDYLDQLYRFVDKEYIDTPDFNLISQEIQEKISGKLTVEQGGTINYIDKDKNTIPLSLTAMGISNIGLIDLLLRNNIINKDSFLIMDEPEVHLHPEWQVFLAEILYKIAKSGATIILATHSLDFLKQFEVILKREDENAEDIIAINKMPFNKEFAKLTELEKVNEILDDLSKPFYDLYMQDI